MSHPTVHVIATSMAATRAALEAATPFAHRQQARLVLIVARPQWPGESECATRSLIAQYDQLLHHTEPPVRIRLCMARSVAEAAAQLTPANATLFIGGRSAWFWPSGEERLPARLRRSGRKVIFVGVETRE